jgi:predicted metalloprotease
MRFNPKARLDTGQVSDSGGGGGLGGGGTRLPIPGGVRAGGGITGLLLVLALFVISQCTGVDLTGGGGGGGAGFGFQTQQMADADTGRYDHCKTGADAEDDPDCARVAFENSLRDYWKRTLPEQDGTQFQPATIQTFSGGVSTGCGQASSQVGPFYCPPDQGMFLDSTFFDQVLEQQLGGPDGGFVEGYVVGHEYGHHIQNLLGTMGKVRTQQGPKSDAVRLELQADCYAGMWARAIPETKDDAGEPIFEISDEDVRLAIEAAQAVGDDRIQQKTQGQVTEESWTHGSAESRMKWFQIGMEQGTLKACDTWAVDTP